MSASQYTIDNILDALMRNGTFVAPAQLWVSLHTGDPGDAGANEVTGTEWSSYVRRDSLQSDTKANAWAAPDPNDIVWNQKQLIYPIFDGPSAITITYFGIWDAETVGNFLTYGVLTTPRTIDSSQVFVADRDKLGVKVQ